MHSNSNNYSYCLMIQKVLIWSNRSFVVNVEAYPRIQLLDWNTLQTHPFSKCSLDWLALECGPTKGSMKSPLKVSSVFFLSATFQTWLLFWISRLLNIIAEWWCKNYKQNLFIKAKLIIKIMLIIYGGVMTLQKGFLLGNFFILAISATCCVQKG